MASFQIISLACLLAVPVFAAPQAKSMPTQVTKPANPPLPTVTGTSGKTPLQARDARGPWYGDYGDWDWSDYPSNPGWKWPYSPYPWWNNNPPPQQPPPPCPTCTASTTITTTTTTSGQTATATATKTTCPCTPTQAVTNSGFEFGGGTLSFWSGSSAVSVSGTNSLATDPNGRHSAVFTLSNTVLSGFISQTIQVCSSTNYTFSYSFYFDDNKLSTAPSACSINAQLGNQTFTTPLSSSNIGTGGTPFQVFTNNYFSDSASAVNITIQAFCASATNLQATGDPIYIDGVILTPVIPH